MGNIVLPALIYHNEYMDEERAQFPNPLHTIILEHFINYEVEKTSLNNPRSK
jgi:hypothetical protein